MSNIDESTRLLKYNSNSNLNGGRYESLGLKPSKQLSRPPLISVPSTQSVKSLKGLSNFNNPLLNTYVGQKSKDLQDDGNNSSDFIYCLGSKTKEFDRFAYIAYYLPILRWLPKYKVKESLLGDFLAGVSMASFQVPLVMSFATSLAHLPPINGLYSIIIGSCTYAILGCVPVLIVGPSPSTALIYGQVVEVLEHEERFKTFSQIEISSTISAAMGGILLASGILRFGYLDNILSRSLLKGFIAAMGCIMIINELATEMGIYDLSRSQPHQTTLDKLLFILRNYGASHKLTTILSCVTLLLVLLLRKIKLLLVNKYKKPSCIYIPELLMMIMITTILSWYFKWNDEGIDVVGNLAASNDNMSFINPIQWSKIALYKRVFSTSFLCTILGYIDSTTATKALGVKYNFDVSSNRELIALGSANIIVSLVGGLPSFGALGRSKINILSGARTPMAGILMSIATVFCIIYLLPLLFSLPECVLALSTTVVGITVLEEIPSDLKFFWNIRGYDELLTFAIVFLTTLLWSAEAGVFLGILVALTRVLKYSTTSRIQILGRIPNTSVFRNADELIEESFSSYSNEADEYETSDQCSNLVAEIEEIEGVLIIKIPEPLNFANVSSLKSKLSRIEKFGSLLVHPSQPKHHVFDNSIKFILFDCKGMQSIDSSATQVLYETVKKYIEVSGIKVYFSRVPMDGNVRELFRKSGIVELVNKDSNSEVDRVSNSRRIISSEMGEGFYLSIEEALKSIELQSQV